MADKRDSVDDKLDLEQVENRSVSQSVEEVSPEERKLVRKIDLGIMPLASVLYLFACKSRCRRHLSKELITWQTWTEPTWEMPACRVCRRTLSEAIPLVCSLTG